MPTCRQLCAALIVLLATLGQLQARPELRNVSIQFGSSPRMNKESWAYFNFRVVNPETTPARVQVVLRPVGQRNITVYEQFIELKPEVDLRYRILLTIGTVEDYEATMYFNGNELDKQQAPIRVNSVNDRMVYFVNDATNLDYGNFAKNNNLKARYVTTAVRANNTPTHWVGYDRIWMLVLMQPNYDNMSQRQYNAILDFVARGGTLLFCDPVGVQGAASTPLGTLLNVEPIRLRKLEHLTGNAVLGGTPISWEDGEDFLESVPVGDGITTATQGDFPLVRWSRYGLGTVGTCAVNPSQRSFRQPDEANFNTMWLHFLSYGGQLSYPSSVSDYSVTEAIDSLTGIKIPQREFIRMLLGGLLAVVLLTVGVGIVTRRQVAAWTFLATFSVGATIAIFAYSRVRDRDLPARNATVLDFRVYGPERDTGDQITSLFSKNESIEQLKGSSPDVLLRSLTPASKPKSFTDDMFNMNATSSDMSLPATRPADDSTDIGGDAPKPRRNPIVDEGSDQAYRDPLQITRNDGAMSVNTLNLRAKAPRFLSILYSLDEHPATPDTVLGVDLPVVQWKTVGPTFAPAWPLPASLKATSGALFCEAGFIPVIVDKGLVQIAPRSGSDLIAHAADVNALQKFLVDSRSASPMLVLFSQADSDDSGMIPGVFRVDGRRVHLIPVRQQLDAGALSLPAERFRIDAFAGQSRMLRQGDAWGNVPPIRGDAPPRQFEIAAYLPPGFGDLSPQSVRVNFEAENRGRNIRFELRIRHTDDPDGERDIAPTRVDGTMYFFENLPAGLVDKRDGQLTVVVIEHQITIQTDPTATFRMNAWKIREFNVAASGEWPREHAGKY